MVLKNIDIDIIDSIADNAMLANKALIGEIMSYQSDLLEISDENERAFPGDRRFVESGYYKTMLKRYLFAGSYFCGNKHVLDCCCGLGWGTYIISHYAKTVTAFDLSPEVVNFCRNTWKAENILWNVGDTLDLSFLGGRDYDIGLGMETIEHFTKEQGQRFLSEVSHRLKVGGIMIGTSSFPLRREDAEALRENNPKHLHIYTYDEINELLPIYFTEHIVVNNWMFIARK